jgi:rhodanese-related sulfurtransferase/CBS domain-containing protein
MVEVVDLDGVRRLLDEERAQLVEVLPRPEYEDEHLPGALSLPLKEIGPEPPDVLDPARPVIVCCYDWLCDMSPRAAARLASLGLARVYDYAAGKVDWLAHGFPREGTSAARPYAGDRARGDVPTCRLGDTVGEASASVGAADHNGCLVLDADGVLHGLLGDAALSADPAAPVESLLEPGPVTHRANDPVERLLEARPRARHFIVTTPRGRLLGVLSRAEAEGALAAPRSHAQGGD